MAHRIESVSCGLVRPCPHHSARDRVRGARLGRATQQTPVLAATLRDGAIWVHFVAVGPLVYAEYTAVSAV